MLTHVVKQGCLMETFGAHFVYTSCKTLWFKETLVATDFIRFGGLGGL